MEEKQKVWFASDHHFGHKFLQELRNFASVDDHDQAIIAAHNSVVGKGDDVYFLGDFTFKGTQDYEHYTKQMNGNLHLIRGNHDKIALDGKPRGFSWVKDYYETKFPDMTDPDWKAKRQHSFILSHYPMVAWHWNNQGSIMLHGHTHGSLRPTEVSRGKTMDVYICEENDWKPYELKEILAIMKDRPKVAPDCENY